MIDKILPPEATHSSLDIFERSPLLISFDSSFEQKIGPSYSPNGPTIDFEVVGNRNYFIDLSKIYLELKWRIKKLNGNNLVTGDDDEAQNDSPSFVSNILHSFFVDCNVFANGLKISSTNGLYGHKSFLETEWSHSSESKNTWLSTQGYEYESDP